MNIRNVDLNLLSVLKELLLEKNTVRVGQKLGLSQPAVSHALKRLRVTFQDPLLVRASRGLVPTRRALELAGPLNALFEQLEVVLEDREKFDPKVARVTFRIATTDYFEQIALAPLIALIETGAPHCTIITRPTIGKLPKEELETGAIDLAIAGFYGELPENFYRQQVFQDDFVCVARKGNPNFRGELTLAKYAKARHILISPQGDLQSRSRALLKAKGHEQQFQAGVSSFTSPGWIVSASDLLLTCPRKLAMSYKKYLPVDVKEAPFDLGKISVVQVWHQRNHKDPANAWLRSLISKVCSSP